MSQEIEYSEKYYDDDFEYRYAETLHLTALPRFAERARASVAGT